MVTLVPGNTSSRTYMVYNFESTVYKKRSASITDIQQLEPVRRARWKYHEVTSLGISLKFQILTSSEQG